MLEFCVVLLLGIGALVAVVNLIFWAYPKVAGWLEEQIEGVEPKEGRGPLRW